MYHSQPNSFGLLANNFAVLVCIYFSNPDFYMINNIDRGRQLVNKTILFCSCFVQVGTKCALVPVEMHVFHISIIVCKKILEMLLQNVLS